MTQRRMAMLTTLVLGAMAAEVSMTGASETPEKSQPKTYKVRRLAKPFRPDGQWDKAQWRSIEPLLIANFMGAKPAHFPQVQAKLQYDDAHIYAIFRVADRYVRAVAKETHGAVWKDSCVEFFFTPGEDVSQGYLNLEVNCGGTALFHFQKAPQTGQRPLDLADVAQAEIAHSMPKIVEPEITAPTTWTIEYRIPFAVIEKYIPMTRPKAGVVWRANFYKIADDTSHPHWLTWSVVERPQPDFHRPEFFGRLEFQ